MQPGDLVADRYTHQPLGRVAKVYRDSEIIKDVREVVPSAAACPVQQPYRILVDTPPGPHVDGAWMAHRLMREEDLEVVDGSL